MSSLRSSSSSSKKKEASGKNNNGSQVQTFCSTGGKWTCTLYFTPNAKKVIDEATEISHEQLISFFKNVEGTREEIKLISVYKNNISAWIPKLFGMWHDFIVVMTANWYWSFEKAKEGIFVQRSKDFDSVYKQHRGVVRTGWIKAEGTHPRQGKQGLIVQKMFEWIFDSNFLTEKYKVIGSNCKDFASMLLKEVAGD